MKKTEREECVLYDRECIGCMECEVCDLDESKVCDNCGKCVEVCPARALDGEELVQQACWDHAFGDDPEKQVWRISCHACRDVCPYCLGSRNGG